MDTVFSFNMETMTWTTQPSLQVERFGHSCGVLSTGTNEKLIIVTGGITFDFLGTISSVETLMVIEEKGSELLFANLWEYGPAMPLPLSGMARSTIKLGQQQALVFIGGRMLDYQASSHVLKLECADLMCEWTKMDYELSVPTDYGLALHLA